MIRIQNVLVATDFSETSGAALDYGREIARTFGSTLHVLHVADNIYAQSGVALSSVTSRRFRRRTKNALVSVLAPWN